MSLTYSSFVTSIANLMAIPSSDGNLATVLPNIIDDAEQRLYRELDLINTVVRDSSTSFSTATRTFNLPSSLGTFVVVEDFNVITPAGQTNPELGTRNPLVPASKEMLDFLFPSSTASAVPSYFAMVSQSTVVVGPFPDQAYQVEVVGTIRPPALSSSVATTLLSVYFPDVFIAASMVFAAGYMKNFGVMADDPKMGVSWESHLGALMASAQVEENRKKFAGPGWSPKQPAPLATPPRN
jgi:hypothetical protein